MSWGKKERTHFWERLAQEYCRLTPHKGLKAPIPNSGHFMSIAITDRAGVQFQWIWGNSPAKFRVAIVFQHDKAAKRNKALAAIAASWLRDELDGKLVHRDETSNNVTIAFYVPCVDVTPPVEMLPFLAKAMHSFAGRTILRLRDLP